MKITYSQSVADAGVLSTKITNKSGVFSVAYTNAAGTHNSAVIHLYDSAGTPTCTLDAGNGTQFSIAANTASKVNVYWATDQLKVQNNSGETLEIKIEGEFYSL